MTETRVEMAATVMATSPSHGITGVKIGTSSWTDPTLVKEGNWYPPGTTTAKARLEFYASRFPLVEVDSTYYFPPSEKNSVLWIERTPADFTFNIKAYSLLTNHPTRTESLYKDLAAELPEETRAKRRIYRDKLPDAVVDEVWQRFRDALMPLHSAGKLGAVLFQFPQWFVISKQNKAYIEECAARLPDFRVAVEFRHKSWMEERNVEETLGFLSRTRSALRLRRHAPGVRLEPAADRGGDRRRHRDGALPRARPEGVGVEGRDGERTLPLRLLEGRARRVGAQGRGARRVRRARPTC